MSRTRQFLDHPLTRTLTWTLLMAAMSAGLYPVIRNMFLTLPGILLSFVGYLLIPILAFQVVLRALERKAPAAVGFGWRQLPWGAVGAAGGALLGGVTILLLALPGWFQFGNLASVGSALLWSLTYALAPAVAHELALRGILLRSLEERYGTWPALIFVACLPGLLAQVTVGNAFPFAGLAAAAGSLLLSSLYIWRRNLWLVIGLRWALSLVAGFLLGAPAAGPVWVTGGALGAEGGLLWVAVAGVTAALLMRRVSVITVSLRRWWLAPEVVALALAGALLWWVAVPPSAYAGERVEGRNPAPFGRGQQIVEQLPARTATAYADRAFELSAADLSRADLSQSGQALRDQATFDSKTVWPSALPAGFDPNRFMELGKDPGLGVRALHQKGITGKGVHVAFIDQTLLVDHQEYKDRIVRYVELGEVFERGSMHGAATASILAGRTVGVAPEASLTYYAVELMPTIPTRRPLRDFSHMARAVTEILDRNQTLPPAERVRAIGASVGAGPMEPGFLELSRAIDRARREGVLVVLTNTQNFYPKGFVGMNREPDADPNDPASFGPGSFRAEFFWRSGKLYPNTTLVPMDSRTTAAESWQNHYRFYRQGGESWSVPWVVGMYALVAQVYPTITPDAFVEAAYRTGTWTRLDHDGRSYEFGPIIDPEDLIRHFAQQ